MDSVGYAVLGSAVVAVIVMARHIYSYRIGGKSIEILLFRAFPVISIAIADISEIRRASWWETVGVRNFFAARCGNRLFGRIVLIRRKKPRILNSVTYITPNDPDAFISEVLRRISERREGQAEMEKP